VAPQAGRAEVQAQWAQPLLHTPSTACPPAVHIGPPGIPPKWAATLDVGVSRPASPQDVVVSVLTVPRPQAYIRSVGRAVWKARPKPVRTAQRSVSRGEGKAGRRALKRSAPQLSREENRPVAPTHRQPIARPDQKLKPPSPRPHAAPSTPQARLPMTLRPPFETGRGAGHESSRRRDLNGHGHRSQHARRPQIRRYSRGPGHG